MESGIKRALKNLGTGVRGVEPLLLKCGRCVLKAEGKYSHIHVCQSNFTRGI